MHARSHVDDACPFRHKWEEQAGQQERTYVVHTDGTFQSVHGEVLSCFQRAGIVHQAVNAPEALLYGVGKVAYALQVGQVDAHDLYVVVARFLLQFFALLLCLLRAVACHDGMVSGLCHGTGFLHAHISVGTGNYCYLHRFIVWDPSPALPQGEGVVSTNS